MLELEYKQLQKLQQQQQQQQQQQHPTSCRASISYNVSLHYMEYWLCISAFLHVLYVELPHAKIQPFRLAWKTSCVSQIIITCQSISTTRLHYHQRHGHMMMKWRMRRRRRRRRTTADLTWPDLPLQGHDSTVPGPSVTSTILLHNKHWHYLYQILIPLIYRQASTNFPGRLLIAHPCIAERVKCACIMTYNVWLPCPQTNA